MKIKTSELTGAALDWAVAKVANTLGDYVQPNAKRGTTQWEVVPGTRRYSTTWAQGGPIIEREEIGTERRAPCMKGEEWEATGSITAKGEGYRYAVGPTPLIAAMRCYVASKLGDIVDIPEELLK